MNAVVDFWEAGDGASNSAGSGRSTRERAASDAADAIVSGKALDQIRRVIVYDQSGWFKYMRGD